MPSKNSAASKARSTGGLLPLLLLALFATELAVMELFASWLPRLGRIPAAIMDSLVLVLLLVWPLWFFVFQPRGLHVHASHPPTNLPRQFLWKLLAGIFLINFLLMLLQPQLWLGSNLKFGNTLDAFLVTVALAPILWWLLSRAEFQSGMGSLPNLLGTPLGIYVLLLFTVFFADLVQELLLPLVIANAPGNTYQIADCIVTTFLVAPILWLLVAKPLRRAVLSEKTRIWAIHAQLIDAVVTTGATGLIESFNPAAEQIFGYRAENMIGKPATLLFAGDQPGFEALARLAPEAGDGEVTRSIKELDGRHRDGSSLTMEVSLSNVRQNGRNEFLLVMRDISSRKAAAQALRESELRFRGIFEQSEDAIVFFKPGSCFIIDINATTANLFSFSKTEIIAGGVELLFSDEDLQRLKTALNGMRKGKSSNLNALGARRRGGENFTVSMHCKVMTLQEIDVVYCTFRDVTDRIRMEQEAKEIQAKLIQANKMTSLGLLVSGVAHEINNPNNFIIANSRLLSSSWNDALRILREYAAENGEFTLGGVPFSQLDSHSPQLFAGILDGSRRINDIVNNLKAFARQDRVVADSRFDLNQVATAAITILHHELVKYTERFQTEFAENLPQVRGSGQQIGQIIINLLMNACQALPGRSHGIWLGTSWDRAADQVIVTVRDEGCGISAEESRRIMEPFFTTKLDAGGTGLGLSICRSIVREHQGRLEFTSEPGRGSTFLVRLPAAGPGKDSSPCLN